MDRKKSLRCGKMSEPWCSAQTSNILRIRNFPHSIAEPIVIQGFGYMESFQYRAVSKSQPRCENHTIHVIIIVLLFYQRLENPNIYHTFLPHGLLLNKQS